MITSIPYKVNNFPIHFALYTFPSPNKFPILTLIAILKPIGRLKLKGIILYPIEKAAKAIVPHLPAIMTKTSQNHH